MTVVFPFEMGQVVQITGETLGQIRGLWVDVDGTYWANLRRKKLRWKDDDGVFELCWKRCTDCEAVAV